MDKPRSKDPLEGVTLEALLTELVTQYGWEYLGQQVPIRCFQVNPSVKSSLTFLRRTPWARSKVENLYREWKTKSSYEG
ncbi:MAG TPA: VF530 family protein [Oligoflexus sp.]|uniref:VF530 family protein n=1 Tax=Oligoflexus sp. TaxID=1971216 RepID=UPI002D7FB6DE|nr:VF530 family protein [Oligoflexus sp.]HET9236583.1 VF530 family protein [Oligoflexus sp.]